MRRDCTVYHVLPNAAATRWVLSQEDNANLREEYGTKAEAVAAAQALARQEERAQVKVHNVGGNLEHESAFGAASSG